MQTAVVLLFCLVAIGWLILWAFLIAIKIRRREHLVKPQGRYIAEWDDVGSWNQAIGYCLVAIGFFFDIGWLVTRGEGVGAFLQTPVWAWVKTCGYMVGVVYLLINSGVCDPVSLSRLGFDLTKQDLKLGILASVAILPFSWIASSVMATIAYYCIPQMSTYSHPVTDAVKASSLALEYLPVVLVSVILAPACEEIIFRVLMQGRLEYNKLDDMDLIDEDDESRWLSKDCVSKIPWSPIVVTSGVFALLHIGFGVIPISLFVFSICLGYLYRQTGRFWPCFIVHALHNLFSILFVYSNK
jgi:membrane protease YdiL (CAAX protease family)